MENMYGYRYTVICPSTEGHGVSGNERKGRGQPARLVEGAVNRAGMVLMVRSTGPLERPGAMTTHRGLFVFRKNF